MRVGAGGAWQLHCWQWWVWSGGKAAKEALKAFLLK
jgi:hypothetical protein